MQGVSDRFDLMPTRIQNSRENIRPALQSRIEEPEPCAEEPEVNCLLEPEPKLQIAAPALAPAPLHLLQT
jgi:hypothetical protein